MKHQHFSRRLQSKAEGKPRSQLLQTDQKSKVDCLGVRSPDGYRARRSFGQLKR
jgi:hypothetical protein